jgi:Carboxypeptidase regulatory-like domain
MTNFPFMSRLLLASALMCAATVCTGQLQEPPPVAGASAPQATSRPRTVGGEVINSVTGQPIARALVQLGSQHAALTDHDGRFEFENVVDGFGVAFASKPGYFPRDNAAVALNQPLTLQLIPEAILSGTITDQAGQPIQNLQVQLKTMQVHLGLRHWQQAQGTTTNAEGEFRFAELQAGEYSLATGFFIEGLPEAESSIAFVPLVFPPLAGDGFSGALTLAPGDHIEENLNLQVEKLYPVTGLVHGRIGQGVSFEVETKDGETISPPARVHQETGAFRLMLPSGSYRIRLRSFAEREQLVGTSEITVGHAPLQGVSIALDPQAIIPVEVEFQEVNNSAQEGPTNAASSLNISLQQADAAGPMRMFSAQQLRGPAETQAPGSGGPLVFQYVEPGHYELQAQMSPPWYLASASCGNLDLMREPLVIAPGVAACSIRALLRNDSASLKWSIAAGEPGDENNQANRPETVFVEAIPLGNLTQPVGTVRATGSPAEGTFEGLAPGRYLVIALNHEQELPYRDTTALQRYLTLGQEVTLARNGKSEVQLQVAAGEP